MLFKPCLFSLIPMLKRYHFPSSLPEGCPLFNVDFLPHTFFQSGCLLTTRVFIHLLSIQENLDLCFVNEAKIPEYQQRAKSATLSELIPRKMQENIFAAEMNTLFSQVRAPILSCGFFLCGRCSVSPPPSFSLTHRHTHSLTLYLSDCMSSPVNPLFSTQIFHLSLEMS